MAAFVIDLPVNNGEQREQDMAPLLLTRTSSIASTATDRIEALDHRYRLTRDYILPAESCQRHATYKEKLKTLKNILTPSLSSLRSSKARSSMDAESPSSSRNSSQCSTPTEAKFHFTIPAQLSSAPRLSLKEKVGNVGSRIIGSAYSKMERLQTDPEEKAARKAARKEAKEKRQRELDEAMARMSVEARDEFGIPYGYYDWRLGLAYCW